MYLCESDLDDDEEEAVLDAAGERAHNLSFGPVFKEETTWFDPSDYIVDQSAQKPVA